MSNFPCYGCGNSGKYTPRCTSWKACGKYARWLKTRGLMGVFIRIANALMKKRGKRVYWVSLSGWGGGFIAYGAGQAKTLAYRQYSEKYPYATWGHFIKHARVERMNDWIKGGIK